MGLQAGCVGLQGVALERLEHLARALGNLCAEGEAIAACDVGGGAYVEAEQEVEHLGVERARAAVLAREQARVHRGEGRLDGRAAEERQHVPVPEEGGAHEVVALAHEVRELLVEGEAG